MILEKISVDSDLSEGALEVTLDYWDKPTKLFVSTGQIKLGVRLAQKYNLKLCVDNDLNIDGWYVTGQYNGIFSPGA